MKKYKIVEWTRVFEENGYVFEKINNHIVYSEDDAALFNELYENISLHGNFDKAFLQLKIKHRNLFTFLKYKTHPEQAPATKKQLFALFLASGRKIITTDLKISRITAGVLISRSKNGEDVLEELSRMPGAVRKEEPLLV